MDRYPTELELDIPQYRAETVFEYLNITDRIEPADCIFVLGGSSLEPVKHAAELYHAGIAPKLAFVSSGGRFGGESKWGVPEVEKYRETLLVLGVPESDLVYEGEREKQTSNTKAEALYSSIFLKSRGFNPEKMILVSRPVHQMRAFLTFAGSHPDTKYINSPATEPFDINNIEEIQRLVQEIERLLDYGANKDDIVFPDIPPSVLQATAEIRHSLREHNLYVPRTKPTFI